MGRYRTTELGVEARCSKCGEYWPADLEFFFKCRDSISAWCKACYIEWQREKGQRPGYGKRNPYGDHVAESRHG